MTRITRFFFGFAHLSLAIAQSYTSLEDMPAWKTLPPGASKVVTIANGLYYAGCVTSVPQISTAACYATLPEMSSSLLSNIVSAGFWNPNVPTQFQASATSVAKAWYGQPAVKAAIGMTQPVTVLIPLTSDQAQPLPHQHPQALQRLQAPQPRRAQQHLPEQAFRSSALQLRSSPSWDLSSVSLALSLLSFSTARANYHSDETTLSAPRAIATGRPIDPTTIKTAPRIR